MHPEFCAGMVVPAPTVAALELRALQPKHSNIGKQMIQSEYLSWPNNSEDADETLQISLKPHMEERKTGPD